MRKAWSWPIVGVFMGLLVGALVFAGIGQAAPEGAPLLAPVGTAFTYQGFISDNGNPVNGSNNLRFSLWDDPAIGSPVGSTQTKSGVNIVDGLFTVTLDFGSVFDGTALWLAIEVQSPGDPSYTMLNPRQALTPAPYASYAMNIPLAGSGGAITAAHSDHDHWGQTWTGSGTGLTLSGDYTGLDASGTTYGVRGRSSTGGTGVYGEASATSGYSYGVYGTSASTEGGGVFGWATATSGLAHGVSGTSASTSGYGGYFLNNSADGVALYALGYGGGRNKATLQVNNNEPSDGMAAYLTNSSDFHTAHFYNAGTGGALYLQNGGSDAAGTGGGDFITAVNSPENDIQFQVLSSGEVRSDVGFNTPAADFAEMLPAVPGLEPGDVLVIGPDGKLARSSQPYQTSVVGAHSTQPGFVGGQPVEGKLEGSIPLAVVGVVPVKVSSENGAIQPGDLLVSSSLPGYAMAAGDAPPIGTVLGKALEPLVQGTGLILVLVMLQ